MSKKLLLIAALLLALPLSAAAINIFQPVQGGTGTGTKPNYGDVLVGNAGGTYTPTATSSLGITGGGGSQSPWTGNINGNGFQLTNINGLAAIGNNPITIATTSVYMGGTVDTLNNGFGASPLEPSDTNPAQAHETILSNLDSDSAFVQSGPGTMTYSSDAISATTSLSLTSDGVGGNLFAQDLNISPTIDMSNSRLSIWIKVSTSTPLKNLWLYAGSDNLVANYYIFKINPMIGTGASSYIRPGQWAHVTVDVDPNSPLGGMQIVGSPDRTKINSLQLLVTDKNTGNPVTVLFNKESLVDRMPVGILTMSFDDGYQDVWDNIMPYMEQVGMPATQFINPDFIGTANHLTFSELQQQQALGWSISCHTWNHAHLLTAGGITGAAATPISVVEQQLSACKSWLQENGFFSGIDDFAYPFGEQGTTTQAMVSQYFRSARGINGNAWTDTIPPDNPMLVRALEISSSIATSTIEGAITDAANNHEWLVLFTHDPIPGYNGASTQPSVAKMKAVIDFATSTQASTGLKFMNYHDALAYGYGSNQSAVITNGNYGVATSSPGAIFSVSDIANLAEGTSSIYTKLALTYTGNAGDPSRLAIMNTGAQAAQESQLVFGGFQGKFKNMITSVLNAGGATSNLLFRIGNGATTTAMTIRGTDGYVGIGTTTPGSLLSIGTSTTGINFQSGTSTFNTPGGINLNGGGCFAINDVCVSGGGGGSGTVGSGSANNFPYYAANGTTLTATSAVTLLPSGNVGIGSTTPWAQFAVMSTINPMFIVASSSGSHSFLSVFSTTTIQQLISTVVTGILPDEGVRVGIGMGSYLGFGGLLDQFVVRGRINTEGWNEIVCDLSSGLGNGGATSGVCGAFNIGVAGGIASGALTNSNGGSGSGYAYAAVSMPSTNLNGVGTYLTAGETSGGAAWMSLATDTPVMEINARIHSPQNSTSTMYTIGFSGNGSSVITYPTNGCFFNASSSASTGDWYAVAANSSAYTFVDTGVASSTNVTGTGGWRKFRIEGDNAHCAFYIQNGQSGNLAQVANITTNIPTAGVHSQIWIANTASTTVNAFDFNHYRLWWRDFLPVL